MSKTKKPESSPTPPQPSFNLPGFLSALVVFLIFIGLAVMLAGRSAAQPTADTAATSPAEQEMMEEEPTAEPTDEATAEPTDEATAEPTDEATAEPTDEADGEADERPLWQLPSGDADEDEADEATAEPEETTEADEVDEADEEETPEPEPTAKAEESDGKPIMPWRLPSGDADADEADEASSEEEEEMTDDDTDSTTADADSEDEEAEEEPTAESDDVNADDEADSDEIDTESTETEGSSQVKKTYSQMPEMLIDPEKQYFATITTPRGDIEIKLLPDIAPKTVNSFVFLVREGFYDGLTWHRVIEGFMAQGGDPQGSGTGGPGYNVPAEFTSEILFDRPGIVAMARRGDDVNSAGSQFFITTAATPFLNNQYTIFGEVIEGQEIVNNIPLRDPMRAQKPGEEIVKITITEKE